MTFDYKDGRHYLKKHISLIHEQKKPLNCKYCNAAFAQKQSLNCHTESVHRGKKSFKCNDCDASFSQKGHLNK